MDKCELFFIFLTFLAVRSGEFGENGLRALFYKDRALPLFIPNDLRGFGGFNHPKFSRDSPNPLHTGQS